MAPSSRWGSQRALVYRAGSLGMMLSVPLFIAAFSAPSWTSLYGLWASCSPRGCTSNLRGQSGAWLNTARVLETVSLVTQVVCVLLLVVHTCCLHTTTTTTTTVLVAAASGLTGISGAVVFVVGWLNDSHTSPTHPSTHQLSPTQHPSPHQTPSLHWGFALALTASIIMSLSAVLLACSVWGHRPAECAWSVCKPGGRELLEDVSRTKNQTPDSAMMLVPASHFDNPVHHLDPPPYALPPPYPYPSACEFFLPIASSSAVPQITDSRSVNGSCQPVNNADRLMSDRLFDGLTHKFMSHTPAMYAHEKHAGIHPLFVKTEGGSEIEITPSAHNSSGLPSPFNRF